MNRRKFLSLMGAAGAVTAAGLLLPSTRTFFLPPAAGWVTTGAHLNVGDVITFGGVHDHGGKLKQFIVRKVSGLSLYDVEPMSEYPYLNAQFREVTRYDAVYTKPDGEERQIYVDSTDDAGLHAEIIKHNDDFAREMLRRRMIEDGGTPGTPGAKYFNLELPRLGSGLKAEWI